MLSSIQPTRKIISNRNFKPNYTQKQDAKTVSAEQWIYATKEWLSILEYWQKKSNLLLKLISLSESKSVHSTQRINNLYSELFQLTYHHIPRLTERLNDLIKDAKKSQQLGLGDSFVEDKKNEIYTQKMEIVERRFKFLTIKLLEEVIDTYPVRIF